MESQGPIRIGIVLASTVPSVFCFGASAYLLSSNIHEGWGWLMLIGVFALELPKQAIKACSPRRRERDSADYCKPEPVYQEFA